MLANQFFDQDACDLSKQLLGKIIRMKYRDQWLCAKIIETEAYYLNEKGSHSSLGLTEKRRALFMPAGTIYMYYARGKDSLNISCRGEGNAVLIKSAIAFPLDNHTMIAQMQQFHAVVKTAEKLCSGQTLLCRSLNIKVPDWDKKQFDEQIFFIDDIGYQPKKIIQTKRLGIPLGRDEHLEYRFIDFDYAPYCTSNPLKKKNASYQLLSGKLLSGPGSP